MLLGSIIIDINGMIDAIPKISTIDNTSKPIANIENCL